MTVEQGVTLLYAMRLMKGAWGVRIADGVLINCISAVGCTAQPGPTHRSYRHTERCYDHSGSPRGKRRLDDGCK